jgi:hypothetical protein
MFDVSFLPLTAATSKSASVSGEVSTKTCHGLKYEMEVCEER